ncbi:MAG: hypothetical protein ACOY3I_03550 [Verrucomicrobiota bacterium]
MDGKARAQSDIEIKYPTSEQRRQPPATRSLSLRFARMKHSFTSGAKHAEKGYAFVARRVALIFVSSCVAPRSNI